MARFSGRIGYGETIETPSGSGVWKDVITEYFYRGDVISNSRSLEPGTSVNDDISVGNSISIVASPYAREHIFAMRYISWQGALWKIDKVDVEHPRLLLRLGGVYSGPTAGSP